MRFFIAVLIIILLNYVLGMFLPWWIIAIGGFAGGYFIKLVPGLSFLAGFLAGFLLWSILALSIDLSNEQVLSKKIVALFGLPEAWLMTVITGLIGGLVTGMGALSGALLEKHI